MNIIKNTLLILVFAAVVISARMIVAQGTGSTGSSSTTTQPGTGTGTSAGEFSDTGMTGTGTSAGEFSGTGTTSTGTSAGEFSRTDSTDTRTNPGVSRSDTPGTMSGAGAPGTESSTNLGADTAAMPSDMSGMQTGEVLSISGNRVTIRDAETGTQRTLMLDSGVSMRNIRKGDRVNFSLSQDNPNSIIKIDKES